MPSIEGRDAIGLVVHPVALVALRRGALLGVKLQVERLDAVEAPCAVVAANQEHCVKVDTLFHHDARDDARLVGRVLCIVPVRVVLVVVVVVVGCRFLFGARLARRKRRVRHVQLRMRKLCHVAYHRGRGVALLELLAFDLELVVEPLAPGAELAVAGDDHGKSKDALLGQGLGRAREEEFQVVRGAKDERLPLRSLVARGHLGEGVVRHHAEGDPRARKVRVLALEVLRARDARTVRRVRILLAVVRAVHAHRAHAAAARRGGKARLTRCGLCALRKHLVTLHAHTDTHTTPGAPTLPGVTGHKLRILGPFTPPPKTGQACPPRPPPFGGWQRSSHSGGPSTAGSRACAATSTGGC